MVRLNRFLVLGLVLSLVGAAGSFAADRVARVRPISEAELGPMLAGLLEGTRSKVGALEGAKPTNLPKPPAILRTVAHLPDLMGPFLDYSTVLAQHGTLSRRDAELLTLRVSWNCQSEFEWGHHESYARLEGMTREEIARITKGPEAEGWSTKDRALLRAADQLHAKQQIDDAVWKELAARYSEAQLVEIPFVVGHYTMLSMVANSTEVELEERYERLPTKVAP
ncbi:MAG: carboxymuconolactone decarboxylase family protein [Myxococcota bacterium]